MFCRMTLAEWLRTHGTKPADLAKACGVNIVTVYKWKNGTSTPRPAQAVAIARATGGAVKANDFLPGAAAKRPGLAEAQTALADEARTLGIDPDAIAEMAIREAVRAEKARRWQEENREAMDAWNAWTDANELPLAKYRLF
jgi:antitoxin CcdA